MTKPIEVQGQTCPCGYGQLHRSTFIEQSDADAEHQRVLQAFVQAGGASSIPLVTPADRARLRIDVLAKLGNPVFWTQKLEDDHRALVTSQQQADLNRHLANDRCAWVRSEQAKLTVADLPSTGPIAPPQRALQQS